MRIFFDQCQMTLAEINKVLIQYLPTCVYLKWNPISPWDRIRNESFNLHLARPQTDVGWLRKERWYRSWVTRVLTSNNLFLITEIISRSSGNRFIERPPTLSSIPCTRGVFHQNTNFRNWSRSFKERFCPSVERSN